MKIIISENRIESAIYKYIDDYYDADRILEESMRNMDMSKKDCGIEYIKAEDDYYYDHTVFKLYFKDYWIYPDDPKIELSPLLLFDNEEEYDNLNLMFGNRWKPVFKRWFKDKFNEDIKTIEKISLYWNKFD